MTPRIDRSAPPAQVTDAQLEARFDVLVREEYGRLAELAAALLRSRTDAEDIVQDVLLAVWRHRARFDFDDPRPYLVRAVRNRVVSRRSQHSFRERCLHLLKISAASAADGNRDSSDGDPAVYDETARALDAALASLTPRSREIFLLQRVSGLSYAQIAATLGIAPKTVENLMGRALQRLRQVMRRGGHLSASILVALVARLLGR
jgi:RNA polymerase sigma-70 factor (ECF subfamily)